MSSLPTHRPPRTKLVSVPHCCPAQSTYLGRIAFTACLGDEGATCQVQHIWNTNSGGFGADKQVENFSSVQSGLREGDIAPTEQENCPWACLVLSRSEEAYLPQTYLCWQQSLQTCFFKRGKKTACPLTAMWWSGYKTGFRLRKAQVQILTLTVFSWPASGKLMLGSLGSPICKMGITEIPPAWGWHHYNVPFDFLDVICTYYLQILAFHLLS